MTNETKQTAVEWLIDIHFGGIENVTPDFKKHIQQAKEMEKEQIIDAFTKGNRLDVYDGTETSGKQYYNESYGGNKIQCTFHFGMDTSTSTATKCKFCGKEKWQHITHIIGRI